MLRKLHNTLDKYEHCPNYLSIADFECSEVDYLEDRLNTSPGHTLNDQKGIGLSCYRSSPTHVTN